jgi:hypothetical protein
LAHHARDSHRQLCKRLAKMPENREIASLAIRGDKRRGGEGPGRKSAWRRNKVSKSSPPLVSFVIPVLNDAGRLARCLRSIAALDRSSGHPEVIVVDNGSTDASVRVAEAAGAQVLQRPRLDVSALRNLGAAEARGGILAFVDADHEIDSGWLTAAVDTLEGPGIGAAGALCIAPPDGTWVQRMYDALRHRTVGRQDVGWLGSGNLAVHRAVFDRAGGFRVGLPTCEDVDLCHRIRAAGFRIVSDDRMRSIHLGDPATLAGLFRGELWRGGHNFRASLSGPISVRALPSIVIPIVNLLALAAGAAGLATATTTGLGVAVGSLAVVGGFASLRAARMITTTGSTGDAGRAFAVACTYDLARALALVVRAGHHRRPVVARTEAAL